MTAHLLCLGNIESSLTKNTTDPQLIVVSCNQLDILRGAKRDWQKQGEKPSTFVNGKD